MTGLTASLARFVADPGFRSVPADALHVARSGFIDTIATMIAGRDEPVVGVVRRFVAARASAAHEASVLFGAERVASADAALINGAAGHALDYDDVALGSHPSTVLVPAVLAEGERLGASGMDVLRAYVVGFEVWAELFAREPDGYHLKGWHPTAVLGTVGAAAAAAHLAGLSTAQCQRALAIAGSMAGGLVANFGSMTKPFHAGRAAACGIEAAHLAAAGLTASPDALEHHAGYLAALSPQGRVDRETPPAALGSRLAIVERGLSIKRYPMCYATHRAIDGVLALVAANDLKVGDVKHVDARVGVAQASMLRNHSPVTALEAKFSMEFAVGAALVARSVGLAELTDAFVGRPEVREAMTRVGVSIEDTHCPIDPTFAFSDRVTIELRDGRRLDSGEIRHARGNAGLPLTDAELRAKFLDCAAGSVAHAGLYERLVTLATLPCVRDLPGCVAAASR